MQFRTVPATELAAPVDVVVYIELPRTFPFGLHLERVEVGQRIGILPRQRRNVVQYVARTAVLQFIRIRQLHLHMVHVTSRQRNTPAVTAVTELD